jgi:hypothetical protein
MSVRNASFVCQQCFICLSVMLDDLSVRNASFVCQEHFMTSLLGTLPLSDRNASFVCQECWIYLPQMLDLSVRNTLCLSGMFHLSVRNALPNVVKVVVHDEEKRCHQVVEFRLRQESIKTAFIHSFVGQAVDPGVVTVVGHLTN